MGSNIFKNIFLNKKVKKAVLKFKPAMYFLKGRSILKDPYYLEVQRKNYEEILKRPFRGEIINYLLGLNSGVTHYLEIGTRNPAHNFNHIKATKKFSVDPGLEYELNPVDFKMTSDQFFRELIDGDILSQDIKFDVIFIDGLHLAAQVDRDIQNSLRFIKDEGFIVLHDCNPSTEWHAREKYTYFHTPAQGLWNGTTWKAFLKWRCSSQVNSCCIDSDWGVGIISKNQPIGRHTEFRNSFFEFENFKQERKESLNLISFEMFKSLNLRTKEDPDM